MKPKLTIHTVSVESHAFTISVRLDGRELVEVYDMDYESDGASRVCELLAAMEQAEIIRLEADNYAAKILEREKPDEPNAKR